MDHTVTVSRALPAVFAVLADPIRLSSWVTDIADVSRDTDADRPITLEDSFQLRLQDCDAVGEVIAHEPPWYVAYRLATPDSSHVLRVTCNSGADGATQVQVHQADGTGLAVDPAALSRALLDLDLTR